MPVFIHLLSNHMKCIIAGSRDLTDYQHVLDAVRLSGFHITEVVSGCQRGADTLGEQWAEEQSIPVKQFPAKWNEFGKAAGPIRNGEMARYSQALIAIPSPTGTGTQDMIRQAEKLGLKVYVHYL